MTMTGPSSSVGGCGTSAQSGGFGLGGEGIGWQPEHDRLLHAGFLVLVQREEVRPLLHLDEGAPRRVLHDRDPVPLRCVAEQLVLDLGEEHDLGTDRGQRAERRVLVVGLAPGERRRPPVDVVRDVAVLHEVDHPHRPVVVGRGGGEPLEVLRVDLPVANRGCVHAPDANDAARNVTTGVSQGSGAASTEPGRVA